MALAQASPSTESRLVNYIIMVLMLVVGLLALWLAMLRVDVPYTPDSASYVDQARSLIRGDGFQSRTFNLPELDITQAPDKLFPPGYPILIAAGSVISGVSVETVAPWINRIALALLPLTVFVAFRSVIGTYGAACLGILGGLSPGVLGFGQYALTDILSLILVLSSFGLTLAAWSPHLVRQSLLFAFVGGLVAGFSYLTRNASLAFLVAVPISMGLWFIISRSTNERSRTWRIGLSWVLGASMVVLPWLARNVLVFGQMQSYAMEPSSISAWVNTRTFISAQVYEVIGSPALGTLTGWSIPGLAVLLVMAAVVLHLVSKQWPALQGGEQRAFVFSLIYVALGAAIVIAARTKYQWGEQISERHTLQYALFLLLPAAILLRSLSIKKKALIALTAAIMVALITLRLDSLISSANEVGPKSLRALQKLSVAQIIDESRGDKTGPCANEYKPMVISNYAYLYRILCDANSIEPNEMGIGIEGRSILKIMAFVQSTAGQKPVIAVFHPGKGLKESELPLPDDDLDTLKNEGWIMKKNSSSQLVMARNFNLH